MAKKKMIDYSYPDQNIKNIDYESEMKKSYIDYAMSVLVSRALPDIRDGLKPVHRRIFYEAFNMDLSPNKPYKKSARIVGNVMGKYHPHGDSAIYESMVRMSQKFSMRNPLIDGHGNFGSIDNNGSFAHMRYTEARLQSLALEMLSDLDKNVVDFIPNFDDSLKEPVVLPAKFPNLLVNGTSGIAVGMATNIPSHNLNEVIKAVIAYMKDPNITTKQLLKYIKGPDFPTGGIVINKDDLLSIYETGKGKVKIRSKIEIEQASSNRFNLVITEIPYTYSGSKDNLLDKIAQLMINKKLDEVQSIQDESSKHGLRIILELKKDVDPEKIQTKLFNKTPLQDNFGVNLLALVDGTPKVFTLREYLKYFTEFQREIYEKKYIYLKQKAEKRAEVVQGFLNAYAYIDVIIEALRGCKSLKMVKECLTDGVIGDIKFKSKKSEKVAKTFRFTELQATAILEMRLQRLIAIEEDELLVEQAQLNKEIEILTNKLENQSLLDVDIIKDLQSIAKTYATPRLTVIDKIEEEAYVEEFVVEKMFVALDKYGYLKSFDDTTYNKNIESINEQNRLVIETKNNEKVSIFTEQGKLHQIKVSDITKCKINDKGSQLVNFVEMNNDMPITLFPEIIAEKYYYFITNGGLIKKVKGEEFKSNRRTIVASKLSGEDYVVAILEDGAFKNIELITDDEASINLKKDDFPELKKTAIGVIGLNLKENQCVEKALQNSSGSIQKRASSPKKR